MSACICTGRCKTAPFTCDGTIPGGAYITPSWPPMAPPLHHGCICPPGAEQTCQGQMCPRRAPSFMAST